jgi:hypothetical protein
MSILLHEFKLITECTKQVMQIEEAIIRMRDEGGFVIPQQPQMKEEHQEEVGEEYYAANSGTLDRYFIKNRIAES